MRLILMVLLIAFAAEVKADGVKSWNMVSSSVFSVLPTWPGYADPGYGAPLGTAPEGTGFAISEQGHIITAAHVISKATKVSVKNSKGEIFDAEPLFISRATDLAVLKAKVKTDQAFFSLKPPDIGSQACLISNSFGIGMALLAVLYLPQVSAVSVSTKLKILCRRMLRQIQVHRVARSSMQMVWLSV